VQPGYGEDSPYGPGQSPSPPGPPQQADYGGPLPDYLQPGFAPHGSAGDLPRNGRLPWIIVAVAVVLIVATIAVVLAA
jgi:hypothetical protein